MYKYLTEKEIDEKYPKDDQTSYDKVMCVGYSKEKNCNMYIDFENPEEKTKNKQISNLCKVFFDELTNETNYLLNNNQLIEMEIPFQHHDDIVKAVELKRQGNYFEALKIYKKIFDVAGPSEALLIGVYKIAACAGMTGFAVEFLFVATGIAKMNNNSYFFQNDMLHQEKLILTVNPDKSEMDLLDYLSSLSGNPNYECKMPYEFMKDQIRDVLEKYNI